MMIEIYWNIRRWMHELLNIHWLVCQYRGGTLTGLLIWNILDGIEDWPWIDYSQPSKNHLKYLQSTQPRENRWWTHPETKKLPCPPWVSGIIQPQSLISRISKPTKKGDGFSPCAKYSFGISVMFFWGRSHRSMILFHHSSFWSSRFLVTSGDIPHKSTQLPNCPSAPTCFAKIPSNHRQIKVWKSFAMLW